MSRPDVGLNTVTFRRGNEKDATFHRLIIIEIYITGYLSEGVDQPPQPPAPHPPPPPPPHAPEPPTDLNTLLKTKLAPVGPSL